MRLLLTLTMTFLSLDLIAQSVEDSISNLASQRIALEASIDRIPYKSEQHIVIENYFKNFNNLTLEIKDYPKSLKRFNSSLYRMGVDSFCKNSYIDSSRYNDLIRNCSKNGFFICAEEAKSFAAMKSNIRELLNEDLKQAYIASASCK